MDDPHEVTRLLEQWKAGEASAADEVFRLLYDDLRAIAARQLHRERPDHTLQPTALANEAYLRMAKVGSLEANDRAHFLALVARVVRQVLVDHSREHGRQKRGGGMARVPLGEAAEELQVALSPAEILDLDRALVELAEIRPDAARVVELRFFGDLTGEQIAAEMGSSPATVQRTWQFAKSWLYGRLRGS